MANVTLGPVRISYEHLTKPYSRDGQSPAKYSCTILLPKTSKNLVDSMNAAIEQAKREGVSKRWNGKMPAKVFVAVNDGDAGRPSDGEPYGAECKGMYVFTASCSEDKQPPVVDNHRQPIIDASAIYSGMWANVNVTFFAYDSNGRKGIGVGLNAVQKVKDDVSLGGGKVDVNTAFSAFEVDPITGEPL